MKRSRFAVACLAALGLAMTFSGCQGGSEIPLVEFPKGAPAPPPQVKTPDSSKSLNTTSQGDPAH